MKWPFNAESHKSNRTKKQRNYGGKKKGPDNRKIYKKLYGYSYSYSVDFKTILIYTKIHTYRPGQKKKSFTFFLF